ncbi:hypothetical protein N0V82_008457 [Gnomoniopsis sp. IMI 355080]|nr:hypothetical protein N0V82_008457 [Gnomoniopsis sp. IMI 355080]
MEDLSRPQVLDDYVASYANIAFLGVKNNIDTNPATTTQGPITDPERRHAPTTLAPWTDGKDILDDIFLCLRMLEATGDAEPTDHDAPHARFPCRLHVDETGSELPVINSEAAVHFFDNDTIYKPAKRIIDSALARPTALRNALSAILQRRRYSTSASTSTGTSTNANLTKKTGQIVFSPHSRTVTVPAHIIGHKRKRSSPVSHSPLASGSESEAVSLEADKSDGIIDEIQVSADPLISPDHRAERPVPRERAINIRSGPGDYYCSFVSNKRLPTTATTTTSTFDTPFHQLLLVGEAKAPHKLTRRLIQQALGDNNITIDIRQFIQSAPKTRTPSHSSSTPPAHILARDSGGSSEYDDNQRWLAAVATQIYASLLKKKLRYGYITTGESYILIHIRPEQATTVEYMVLPALRRQSLREAEERDADWLDWLAATPLARLSCLTLLSLFGDGQLTQAEVIQAEATMPEMIWKTPRHREQSLGTASFMSTTTAQTRSSDPEWTEQNEHGHRRAYFTDNDGDESQSAAVSSRKRARRSSDIEDEDWNSSEHLSDQHKRARSDANDIHEDPKSSAMAPPQDHPLTPPPDVKQAETVQNINTVPFCTSRCLAFLRFHGAEEDADPLCPNWAAHVQTRQKPTTASELRRLARACVTLPSYIQSDANTGQDPPVLLKDATENAVYMGQYGASSALFKVRIGSYVLTAKAARCVHPFMEKESLQRLRLEDAVYKKLRALQGHGVPVCLGVVDNSHLQRGHVERSTFWRDFAITPFTGFLLLSWGGSSLRNLQTHITKDQERAWLGRVRESIEYRLSQVHGLGLLHGDAELRNFVVSDGTARVCLIDFEKGVSKGRFFRRLAREHREMEPEDMERRFQQACQREKMLCLEQWDAWAANRLAVVNEDNL